MRGGTRVVGREIAGGRRGSVQGNPPAGLAMSVDSGHLSGALASIGHSTQPPTLTLDSMGQSSGTPKLSPQCRALMVLVLGSPLWLARTKCPSQAVY